MEKFKKYQKNLSLVEVDGIKFIVSYSTRVARVMGNKLIVGVGELHWWSKTTSKHINYAAKELGLIVIDNTKSK